MTSVVRFRQVAIAETGYRHSQATDPTANDE